MNVVSILHEKTYDEKDDNVGLAVVIFNLIISSST